MSRQILDISDLPEEAQERLRDYYERLRHRYAKDAEASEEAFDPRKYRGAIDVADEQLGQRLRSLREEWDRHG